MVWYSILGEMAKQTQQKTLCKKQLAEQKRQQQLRSHNQ